MGALGMNFKLFLILTLLLSIAFSVEAGRKRGKRKGKGTTTTAKPPAARHKAAGTTKGPEDRSYWDVFFDQVVNGPRRQQAAARQQHVSDDLRRPFVLLSVRGPDTPDLRSALKYQAAYTLGADPLGHLLHDGGDLSSGIVAAPLPVKIRPIDPFFHNAQNAPV